MDSPNIPFTCPQCGKVFSRKDNLNRHVRTAHRGDRFICDKCTKSYTTNYRLKEHKCALSQPLTEYQCSKCPEVFRSPRELGIHFRRLHSSAAKLPSTHNDPQPSTSKASAGEVGAPPSPESPHSTSQTCTCRRCHRQFEDRASLYQHQMREGHRHLPSSSQSGSGSNSSGNSEKTTELQPRPWGEGPAPWTDEVDGEIREPGLRDAYNLNAPFILARDRIGDVTSTFNVPITNSFSIDGLMERAMNVYQSLNYSFRLNMAFGVILRHVENGRYRYFHPYAVDPLFARPVYVTGLKGLARLRRRLENLDVMSYLLKQRPNTKWRPVLITNVQFFTYNSNFPLGHSPVVLPDYIRNHKAIISLERNYRNKPYEDRLCAFRSLALHRNPSARRSLEKPTKDLYRRWVKYCQENNIESLTHVSPEQYSGLSSSLFSDFECCFKVNVNVFTLNASGTTQPVYKSCGRFKEHMYLNQYENHLSLITNINVYCKRYQCPKCGHIFRRCDYCNVHQRNCTGQTKLQFPGGFHHSGKSVFDELEENGVYVESEVRHFPWFIVFDFECCLSPVDTGTEKLRWTQEHQPISVSICSNVEGFTSPRCFVDPDQDRLIALMLEYLTEIGDKVNQMAIEKWEHVFHVLNGWRASLPADEDRGDSDIEHDDDDDDDDDDDYNGDEETQPESRDSGARRSKRMTTMALWRNRVNFLYQKFEGYCSQVPVLGFNSARYDLNIIKQRLPKHLALDQSESQAFTVKKNNAYLCQSNQSFKFLDITQYLSPGTSYAQFLKAYGVSENKGFFPYEYLTTPERLEETRLPPLEDGKTAWYSSLKQKSVLDDGLKSIEDNYANLEAVWRREGMTTLRDFLVWYNNLDVGPFVKAVEAMQRFYFEDGIDLFKTTMSVPGVARQKLFRESQKQGISFALFDNANEDLYHTVKANVVGGPSIIFTRYHKAGESSIRGNPHKPCKRIVGYDANALYLWAIDQAMPTGAFVRRKAENGFKPERRDRYMSMFHWMDWLRLQEGWDIRHKLNWGREKRIGPYLVDGYVPNSKLILEYHGCYFHGHDCHLTVKARANEKSKKCLEERCKRTEERAAYIRSQGYKIIEIWECEFLAECRSNRDLSDFVLNRQPPFFRKMGWKSVSESDIIDAVQNDDLFGMVEVDIRIPERWSESLCSKPHNTRLSPQEYFSEMTPLFCNADVPFEVLGKHMQDYIVENDLSRKPRRMLVGGLKAQKMLIATPLLQWYLQHGMVIDRVYQVVEYTPIACFRQFVRDVCMARRAADLDPAAGIRADTAKLVGNSAYGSVLICKEKHTTVTYVQGQSAASREVNLPQFKKLTELDGSYFEVEKAKKVLKLDVPVQLGYYILQYAKLRMLQFYYDFMDVYVDRSNFEYIEMDTDSAYMALSAKGLSDVIKPSKREDYWQQLKGLCCDNDDDQSTRWFPRSCCREHAMHDKRTPGLFKLEFEGDEMIGLCSKTYLVSQMSLQRVPKPTASSSALTAQRLIRRSLGVLRPAGHRHHQSSTPTAIVGRFERRMKFSCKGISKRTLKRPLAAYRNVLRTRVPGEGSNRGFRLKGTTVFSYKQERKGLSYLYCKRRVLDDGIRTAPLDIVLCPRLQRDDNNDNYNDDTILLQEN